MWIFFAIVGKTALSSPFLGCCIAVVSFIVAFSVVQLRIGKAKIIDQFNYTCILCLWTFIICLLPFYTSDDPKWLKGMYRIVNVIVGCIVGALLSVLVLPRSAASLLREKLAKQIRLSGEASEAVLHIAADTFSESKNEPLGFVDEILESNENRRSRKRQSLSRMARSFRLVNKDISDIDGDVALNKFEAALQDWKVTKALFPMLKYDPFNIGMPSAVSQRFRAKAASTLARTLRIQTTVILVDGIVRNDPNHDFTDRHLAIFVEIGTLIRKMLTVPLDIDSNERASQELSSKLAQIRTFIVELSLIGSMSSLAFLATGFESLEVGIFGSRRDLVGTPLHSYDDDSEKPYDGDDDDKGGRSAPTSVHGSRVCALLFLQLVKHLTLRPLRLYHAWKQCESVWHLAEQVANGPYLKKNKTS